MENVKCSCENKAKLSCNTCDEINKIEHLVEKIFPAKTIENISKHLVKMKSLPQEGDIFKIFLCSDSCFFCIGEKYGISDQERYDANKMYTDLLGTKKEELQNEVLHNWKTVGDAKEIFSKYKPSIPVILLSKT